MKTCFKCGKTKPLTEFYCHPQMADGYLNKCKECTKHDVQMNYQLRHDQYTAYDRKRSQDPTRRAQWYQYIKTKRARNPEKHRAYQVVWNALRTGALQRKPCEVCGATKVQAHHADYDKPLDVQWLCFKHHREVAHGQRCAT